MKKFIYFAAVACVALAGCTKNEAVAPQSGTSDQLITFSSPVVGVPTKAESVEFTYDKFRVKGKLHKGDYVNWTSASDYMFTDVAKKTVGAITSWFPVNGSDEVQNYYFPTGDDDYRLTFIAYYPITKDPDVGNDGLTWSNYAIASTSAPTDAQVDLLYSYRTYNKKSSTSGTNTIPGYSYTGTAYPGVNILFEHALSWINFDVKLAAEYSGNTITLDKITLQSIGSTATFTQGLPDAPAGSPQPSGVVIEGSITPWATPTETATYVPYNSTLTLTDEAQSAGSMYLLPQDLSAGAQKVRIDYTLTNPAGVVTPSYRVLTLKDYTVGNWLKGYKYTYHIIIGLEQIYFAPEVVKWNDATTGNITI